ncbi:MAG: ECF transporter S component [Calditrichaeota bacterium]|nr:MAG: ECF transporter S component [Calditrichota bacterium]
MKPSTRSLTRFVFLTALTLSIEMMGLPQPFTGPLINMMLIITSLIINPGAGVILGLFTPILAALRGQLPPPLAPMIPFIVLANAGFVLAFTVFRRFSGKGRQVESLFTFTAWLGLLIASLLKMTILYAAARFIVPLLISAQLPKALILMMAAPQFATALIGGIAALLFVELLHRRFSIP